MYLAPHPKRSAKMSELEHLLGFELLEPWVPVAADPSTLSAELHKELREDGLLFGRSTNALAMRQDCDDILFEVDGLSERFAVVHLTWSGQRDSNSGWPHTELFRDAEDWRLRCMVPDHEDFTC